MSPAEGQRASLLPIDEDRPVEHGWATIVTDLERSRPSLRRLRRQFLAIRRRRNAEALERQLDGLFIQLEQPKLTHLERSAIVAQVRAVLNQAMRLSTSGLEREARLKAACRHGSAGGGSNSGYTSRMQQVAWDAVHQMATYRQ